MAVSYILADHSTSFHLGASADAIKIVFDAIVSFIFGACVVFVFFFSDPISAGASKLSSYLPRFPSKFATAI